MRAICYVLINPEGPKLKKVIRKTSLKGSDSELLDMTAPTELAMKSFREQGWTLCNWHVVNYLPRPTIKSL